MFEVSPLEHLLATIDQNRRESWHHSLSDDIADAPQSQRRWYLKFVVEATTIIDVLCWKRRDVSLGQLLIADYPMDVSSSSSGNSYTSVAIMSGTVFIVFSTICWIFMSSAENTSNPRRRMSGMYSAMMKVPCLETEILSNSRDVDLIF